MNRVDKSGRRELPVLPFRPSSPGGGVEAPAVRGAGGPRIGMVTLGCDKNTVDSERILGRLAAAGARVSDGVDGADVVVVNTCGFIEMAKEESIEAILEAVRLKEEGRARAVVAMGCLVQRYKDELAAELPDVDLFLGLAEVDRLIPELRARGLLETPPPDFVPTMERPLRVLTTTTPHTSFLKISEGCDHACAFCAIPLMRGRHRSTPIELLVREAQELEAAGVVELNIVSQDTTWYGRDWARNGGAPVESDGFFVGRALAAREGKGAGAGQGAFRGARGLALAGDVERDSAVAGAVREARGVGAAGRGTGAGVSRHGALPALLRALLDGTGIPWFRLFYMYPSGIHRELVELIASERRILPYLDMPIQHGSDAVLKRMRRPERRETIRERVRWLREAIPELVLRTTVIVGFPGETEEDFEALLDLLEEIRFDRVGAFAYSAEEGTPAATMPDQLPPEVRRERLERLFDVQRAITLEKNEAWVGREVDVLVDRAADEDGPALGRTAGQAYDVDGVVHLVAGGDVEPGRFVRVRVTDAEQDDLIGEVVGDA
ncbi:MAG TPA: radical SAM protein [Longimicrobiales bacterium]